MNLHEAAALVIKDYYNYNSEVKITKIEMADTNNISGTTKDQSHRYFIYEGQGNNGSSSKRFVSYRDHFIACGLRFWLRKDELEAAWDNWQCQWTDVQTQAVLKALKNDNPII